MATAKTTVIATANVPIVRSSATAIVAALIATTIASQTRKLASRPFMFVSLHRGAVLFFIFSGI